MAAVTTSKASLEAILQAQRYQAGAWQKVVDCGRKYAMMKATGSYMENGNRISLSRSDIKRYEEMFLENLARAAEDAFVEDAIVGATLQEVK